MAARSEEEEEADSFQKFTGQFYKRYVPEEMLRSKRHEYMLQLQLIEQTIAELRGHKKHTPQQTATDEGRGDHGNENEESLNATNESEATTKKPSSPKTASKSTELKKKLNIRERLDSHNNTKNNKDKKKKSQHSAKRGDKTLSASEIEETIRQQSADDDESEEEDDEDDNDEDQDATHRSYATESKSASHGKKRSLKK